MEFEYKVGSLPQALRHGIFRQKETRVTGGSEHGLRPLGEGMTLYVAVDLDRWVRWFGTVLARFAPL